MHDDLNQRLNQIENGLLSMIEVLNSVSGCLRANESLNKKMTTTMKELVSRLDNLEDEFIFQSLSDEERSHNHLADDPVWIGYDHGVDNGTTHTTATKEKPVELFVSREKERISKLAIYPDWAYCESNN